MGELRHATISHDGRVRVKGVGRWRGPQPRRFGRRRIWLAVAVVVVCLVAATVVWYSTHNSAGGIAAKAEVTASSTQFGSAARDVVSSGSVTTPGASWRSDGETTGAWIELKWRQSYALRQVTLVRNPLAEPGATDGFLGFGDGSSIQVRLSGTSPVTVIPFGARSVDRLRFTASAVSAGADNVTVAEILVGTGSSDSDVVVDTAADGNAAPGTSVSQGNTQSPTTRTPDQGAPDDPSSLRDGSGAPGPAGVGAEWTIADPTGAWVRFDWTRPRELSSVAVLGGTRSAATLRSATITFDDGTRLPVGAVLADPTRPTIVGFMPRVTKSVRLDLSTVDGTGSLTLAEVRLYQRGATPVRSRSSGPAALPAADAIDCAPPAAGAARPGLVVRCPQAGSTVDGAVAFQAAAEPGYTTVTAAVWPADESEPAGEPVTVTPDPSGAATLTVQLDTAPPGPLTVEFDAKGPSREPQTVHFQIYHRGGADGADPPASAAARGRTLVYADEFDQPVSRSWTGLGADYAAGKPSDNGAQTFGDAPFADPARGPDTVQVVDNHYLRMDVRPGPGGTHVGSLLASARAGGSGFSAQYGYFEARMLAPAAPGTWPAFWMLPSDNLVTPQPTVAEIDAVELYGHDPKGACHSTHGYQNGKDGGVARCGQRFATDRAALSWHTYGAAITPSGITFSIDGRVVATAPQVVGGSSPMFFLFDLALGGGWPVQLEGVQDAASLYIDYVRVYV